MRSPLVVLVVLAVAASAAASPAPRQAPAGPGSALARAGAAAAAAPLPPRPLHGMPLRRRTGLRLLVASDPPFLLNVDSGQITPVTGLNLADKSGLSVLAVGSDAIVWLDRRAPPTDAPSAEIYVVRQGATTAARLASGWDVAASADGAAVWLKSYQDASHCTVREVALDGHERQPPHRIACSTQLIDASGTLLGEGSPLIDAGTGRAPLRSYEFVAPAGQFALTEAGQQGPFTLTDLRDGKRWRLRYPSRIGGQGGIGTRAVQRNGRLVALSFGDPAYQFTATQVIDLWLLDPATRRLRHLPDMPAAVALKFTSMSWTTDGQLVLLAETGQLTVVAVWRPGDKHIAVRPVQLPDRASGSAAFVVWRAARN